jgi:hypothetical protein
MAYGSVKVDTIIFDNGGSDQNVTVSGLYRATTSGVTLSGTIAATTVSGVTVIGSTTVSGATVTGTTANFTSGNFSNIISSAATMSGALIMANQQQVQFREAVGNGVNHIALQAPAIVSADQTITLPDQTGTVVTTGDNGSVTSTMILDGTILNVDINASAGIVDTKLATISTAGKVSGSAITSGSINTSGQLQITNAEPTVRLSEVGGTATHSQSLLARDSDQFLIQTRSSTGEPLSYDYSIPSNASGATDHIWRIANTEKARLNSSGLTVVNDLTISDKIIHAGDTNTAIRFPANDTIAFETDGSERARIDSSGRLLVGTSTTGKYDLFGAPILQIEGTTSTTSQLGIIRNENGPNGSAIILGKSRGTTNGSDTIVLNNDNLGFLIFEGADGSSAVRAAQISANVDGTPGAGDMPGRLVFSTTADGSASPTERLRIDSQGRMGFNSTALGGANGAYRFAGNITGGVSSGGIIYTPTIQSDVTTGTNLFSAQPATPSNGGTPYTITNVIGFTASQGTFNADSTVTNNIGFNVASALTGATNNYGFFGNLASATGRWNFYGNGTAPNYFAGDVRTNTVVTARTSPANSNVSATATASSLLDGLRTGTPTGNINLTLPTGTDMDSAFQDLQANQSFEWSVINLAASSHVITVVAASGHTVVGNMAVAAATSGRFITRKTAANTFISYRIA